MSGPLHDALAPLTIPVSWVYREAVRWRNRRFDAGRGVERLPVPVISIGNITTGGTGKTPLTAWFAELLLSQGHRPAIAMRGYGARPGLPSDEAMEYAERLRDVPLIVNPDRAGACRAHCAAHPQTDCILLDDGFQHRRIKRDLDLVLIDATANTFRQRLLPAGHLREPLENLSRADAVIVTRAGNAPDANLAALIKQYHGKAPIAWTLHAWAHLRRMDSSGESTLPLAWMNGKQLVTLLGVGNPTAVLRDVEAAGATVAANIPAGDHERFSAAKLRVAQGLCDGLDGLFMTAKDWARSRSVIELPSWRTPIIVPQLNIEFIAGRDAVESLLLRALQPDRA